MKKLSTREELFVSSFVGHGTGARAAREAGYAPGSAKHRATQILKRPNVAAAIEAARKKVQAAGAYNLQAAMLEAEEAMRFAKQTENANAYIKAVEHRAKLNGLLIERHEIRPVGFQVMVAGIDFSKRDHQSEDGREILVQGNISTFHEAPPQGSVKLPAPQNGGE